MTDTDDLLVFITEKIELYSDKLKYYGDEDPSVTNFIEGKLEGFVFLQKCLLQLKFNRSIEETQ